MTVTLDNAWQALLAVAAAIMALTGAGAAVLKMFNPYKQAIKRLDAHDKMLARDLERFEKHAELHEEERRQREADRADIAVLMKGQLALLEHARTNNSSGLMKAAVEELQRHLIDGKQTGA